MKLLTIILSAYVIFLTTLPCVDKLVDIKLVGNATTQCQGHSHQEDADHCSPFCTCDCCVSPVLTEDHIIPFNTYPIPEKYETVYTTAYVSMLFTYIWHPPKLS
jgi:hypothetical protein